MFLDFNVNLSHWPIQRIGAIVLKLSIVDLVLPFGVQLKDTCIKMRLKTKMTISGGRLPVEGNESKTHIDMQ